jgi:4'-phosphopantetheinyl transferase
MGGGRYELNRPRAQNPEPHTQNSPFDALVRGHEVHLWHVWPDDLTDPPLLTAYRALLSPDEIARNRRFVFPKGRHEHLVTRALVRTTLSAYQPAVDPRTWQFIANPYGRPEIAGPTDHHAPLFNLSHTDGLIVCLLAANREIGVDVEDTTRANIGLVEIADRYFSPTEVAELGALPEAARPDRFFDYWTLKESYIKARGLGLQLPLDQFSFHLGTQGRGARGPIRISFGPGIDDDPATWQFSLHRLTARHRLAIAIRRQPDEADLAIRIRTVVPLRPTPLPPLSADAR